MYHFAFMIRQIAIISTALLSIAACDRDESLAGYVETGRSYALIEQDARRATVRATLQFRQGRVHVDAPCSQWHAEISAPYPWWEMADVQFPQTWATPAACELAEEDRNFMQLLERMTLSEVSGNILILSNTDGERMVFQAD